MPIQSVTSSRKGKWNVKVNLARFSWALALIAAMALTVGAGMRWDSFRILFWL